MKYYLVLLILLSSNATFATQKIYQYKTVNNVIEFSDVRESGKTLTREFEIKRTTQAQKKEINLNLEKIRVFNKEFDKRYYDEKKRQYEAAKRSAENKKRAEQKKKAAYNEAVSKLKPSKRRKQLRKDRIKMKKLKENKQSS